MNQMSYPFMPDINTTNIYYHYNKILELEQRIQKLEREVNILKNRLNKKSKPQPLTSKSEIDLEEDNGIYMM